MAVTDRIFVRLTRAQKVRLIKRAKAAKLTIGEYMRQALDVYVPEVDDKALQTLIEQVKRSGQKAASAMDSALAVVATSQKRIADLESVSLPRRTC